jgi:uncharacterized membrane protein
VRVEVLTMQETGEGHRGAAPELSHRARVVVTALVLVLPLACLALALTSPHGQESAWLVIAGANLVVPAVMLPLIWRRPRQAAAIEPSDRVDALATS